MSTAAKVLSPFFSVVVLGLGLGLSPCLGVQGLSAECPEPCCIGRTESHQQLHCHCRVTHRPSYGPNYPRQKSLTHSLILNLIVKCGLPISIDDENFRVFLSHIDPKVYYCWDRTGHGCPTLCWKLCVSEVQQCCTGAHVPLDLTQVNCNSLGHLRATQTIT